MTQQLGDSGSSGQYGERFILMALLGSGGFGDVYRAEDRRLGREVAVKCLRPDRFPELADWKECQREASRQAKLRDHPHVVPVYDLVHFADGTPGIIMGLMKESLADRLRRGDWPTLEQTLRITAQIADALDAAAARGLVHLDVKPGNLLFDEHGKARLGDFSLALELWSTGPVAWPAGRSTDYASPEHLSGTLAPTDRSDVYSLGRVLELLLLHRLPPAGAVPTLTQLQVQSPGATSELSQLLEGMLAPEPSDRPSASTVKQTLRALMSARVPPPAPPETYVPLFTQTTPPDVRFSKPPPVSPRVVRLPAASPPGPRVRLPRVNPQVRLWLMLILGCFLLFEVGDYALRESRKLSRAGGTIAEPPRKPDQQAVSRPGSEPLPLLDPSSVVNCVAAGSRAWLAGACMDGDVLLWDAAARGLPRVLLDNSAPVNALAWSPDGRELLWGDDIGKVAIHRLSPGGGSETLQDAGGRIRSVAWSRDGTRIAAADARGAVIAWHGRQYTQIARLQNSLNDPSAVEWSPDGRLLAIAEADRIVVWEPGRNHILRTLRGRVGKPSILAWHPGSRWLVSAGDSGVVEFWNPKTWRSERSDPSDSGPILDLEWSRDGKRLAISTTKKAIEIWDAASEQSHLSVGNPDDPTLNLSWSGDSKRLWACAVRAGVRDWSPGGW